MCDVSLMQKGFYLGPAEIMYMCDGPIEIFECIFGPCLIGFGRETTEIHSFCIQLVN